MKRIVYLLLVLNLLFGAGISGAETVPSIDPIQTLRDTILSYFPSVSGEVRSVQDMYVDIRIESDLLLKKGTRLSVFREGEPFYHPVTKDVIGKTEIFIGKIEVIEKQDGSYRCSIINGDIKEGDRVRITSSRIKLAFFQERNADWTFSEGFYKSLKDTNRFEIIDAYTRDYEPRRLSEIAKGLNADVMLMFSTPVKDGNRFLNVKLYWVDSINILNEMEVTSGAIESSKDMKALITINPFDTEPWGSYDIERGELIAVGDVDGDGFRELVVSDGRDIRVYSIKDEPKEVWFIKGHSHQRILSVDVLDLNNNGKAEIFVTSISGMEGTIAVDESRFKSASIGAISSFVIEYDPTEGYRRIKEGLPYFFRVSNGRLLMQGFNPDEIFAGSVYEGIWRNGEYITGEPLKLPDGINIYDFTFVDWKGNGDIYLISFDDDGYLRLYKGGELIWGGKSSYGRPYLTFEVQTHSVVNPVKKWSIKNRLVPIRTERGQEIIVVKRNPLVSRIPGLGYSDADVYAIWWNGEIMEERLIVDELAGAITDYYLEGNELFLIARGGIFSFLRKAVKGDFSKGSRLYYYKFIER